MSWWKLKGPSRWFRKEVRDKLSIDDVLDIVRAMTPADKLRIYDLIRTEISTLAPGFDWTERNKPGAAAYPGPDYSPFCHAPTTHEGDE